MHGFSYLKVINPCSYDQIYPVEPTHPIGILESLRKGALARQPLGKTCGTCPLGRPGGRVLQATEQRLRPGEHRCPHGHRGDHRKAQAGTGRPGHRRDDKRERLSPVFLRPSRLPGQGALPSHGVCRYQEKDGGREF